ADDLRDLGIDLPLQVADLGARRDDRRILVAEMRRELSHAALRLRLLLAKRLDQRRLQNFAYRCQCRRRARHSGKLRHLRFGCRTVRLRLNELTADPRHLLRCDCRVLGAKKAGMRTEILGRALRRDDLIAQTGEMLAEPGVGALRRLELLLDLRHDVEFDQRVDCRRGHMSIPRVEADADYARTRLRLDREAPEECVYGARPHLFASFPAVTRNRPSRLGQSRGPARRQKTTEIGQPGPKAWAQAAVEFRIFFESALLDDFARQFPRADYQDFTAHRLIVARQPRQD